MLYKVSYLQALTGKYQVIITLAGHRVGVARQLGYISFPSLKYTTHLLYPFILPSSTIALTQLSGAELTLIFSCLSKSMN